MAVRRRFTGRRTAKKPVSWTRRLFNAVAVTDTPVIVDDIVTPGNWVLGNMNERALIKRLRGALIVSAPPTADARLSFWIAIYVTDIDTTSVPPDTTAILSEDLLYMDMGVFSEQAALAVESRDTIRFDIDVKSMRKIQSDQVIRLVMVGSTAASLTVSGFMSSLLSRA